MFGAYYFAQGCFAEIIPVAVAPAGVPAFTGKRHRLEQPARARAWIRSPISSAKAQLAAPSIAVVMYRDPLLASAGLDLPQLVVQGEAYLDDFDIRRDDDEIMQLFTQIVNK